MDCVEKKTKKKPCCLWNKDAAGAGRVSGIVSVRNGYFWFLWFLSFLNEGQFRSFFRSCVTLSLLGKEDTVTVLSIVHFLSSSLSFFFTHFFHLISLPVPFYPMNRDHITWNPCFLFIIAIISDAGVIMMEHEKKRQRVGQKNEFYQIFQGRKSGANALG